MYKFREPVLPVPLKKEGTANAVFDACAVKVVRAGILLRLERRFLSIPIFTSLSTIFMSYPSKPPTPFPYSTSRSPPSVSTMEQRRDIMRRGHISIGRPDVDKRSVTRRQTSYR